MSRSRQEFSRKTKAEAFARAKGRCVCGVKLTVRTGIHYDHIIPDAVDGGNSVENCQPLCKSCHGVKTDDSDKPEIARTKRVRDKHTNAFVKSGRPMPGSRDSNWKKTFSQGWVKR